MPNNIIDWKKLSSNPKAIKENLDSLAIVLFKNSL
jgi:hypothetical protein